MGGVVFVFVRGKQTFHFLLASSSYHEICNLFLHATCCSFSLDLSFKKRNIRNEACSSANSENWTTKLENEAESTFREGLGLARRRGMSAWL